MRQPRLPGRYLSLDAFNRRGLSEADWVREIAPIFRNTIRTIENLFDPETVVIGGLAPQPLIDELASLVDGLNSSVSDRSDRAHPRVMVASDCQHSALRSAAALAVFRALSPRFGQMFETSEKGIAV